MSTLRHPVGPQPPSVYWRRRLLVGLGLLAVVVVVVLIIVRPGSGEPTGTQSETPAPTDTETPDAPDPEASDPAVGDVAACDPAVVRLTAVTDASSYGNSDDPMISMEIENAGAAPCSFDVGTGAQEYIITSGSDRIWSSADCQEEPTETIRVLVPDETLTTTPFAWDRTRSSTSTCSGSRPEVIAGGASYHLSVKLGEAESAETRQFLLN